MNNELKNVADTERYENPCGDTKAGLEKPLSFECGVNGELIIDWLKTRSNGEWRTHDFS